MDIAAQHGDPAAKVDKHHGEEKPQDVSRYKKIKLIGSGTFGQVYLVQSEVSQKHYVVKEIKAVTMDTVARAQALNEIAILRQLNHPFVIGYRNAWVGDGVLSICMEHAANGDLFHLIKKQKGIYFEEGVVLMWFAQIALALDYIHNRRILHRDIKTQNILIAHDNRAKLGDFGISRVLNNTLEHAMTVVGTPYYLSPELCKSRPYSYKSDVWALGCVLYETLCLKHAFKASNIGSLVIKICVGAYPPLPSHYSNNVILLVGSMLLQDPDKRPTVEQLLRNKTLRPSLQAALAMVSHPHQDAPLEQVPPSHEKQQAVETAPVQSVAHDPPTSPSKPVIVNNVIAPVPQEPVVKLTSEEAAAASNVVTYSTVELSKMKEAANMMISVTATTITANGPSVHERMESLRLFLEQKLGLELFLQTHRAIVDVQYSTDVAVDDEACMQAIKTRMGAEWMFFPLVIQLVNCESSLVSY